MNKDLINISNITTSFVIDRKTRLIAVNDISLKIKEGETLGLVGESGCGKTTLGRTIVKLYKPDSGEIKYRDKNIWEYDKRENLDYRKKVQMIFQDPYASLDPLSMVGESIAEGLEIHKIYRKKDINNRVYELLEMVGLNKEHANRFPHEFSGGQRQRIGIARALAVEPELIICDEPISALDVSIQAQVINLLIELQEKIGLSYLFITHDLSMVRQISNRIAVMYLGSIMELAPSNELYENHKHPYTSALLSAIPIPDPIIEKEKQRIIISGDVPSPIDIPKGCHFSMRCPKTKEICFSEKPVLEERESEHFVACHFA